MSRYKPQVGDVVAFRPNVEVSGDGAPNHDGCLFVVDSLFAPGRTGFDVDLRSVCRDRCGTAIWRGLWGAYSEHIALVWRP